MIVATISRVRWDELVSHAEVGDEKVVVKIEAEYLMELRKMLFALENEAIRLGEVFLRKPALNQEKGV